MVELADASLSVGIAEREAQLAKVQLFQLARTLVHMA